MAGRESRQALRDQPDFSKLAAALHRSLSQLTAAAAGVKEPFPFARNIHPLAVPKLGLVSKLVQQADRHYPMSWSVIGSVVTEDWAETCGFDFVHGVGDEPRPGAEGMFGGGQSMPTRYPKVGMAEIEQASKSANPVNEGALAKGYLDWVRGCIHYAADPAGKLAREAPPLLFVRPADRPWAIRRRRAALRGRQAWWVVRHIAKRDRAGACPK